jgi:dipeptide/tripeptide permease
MVGNLYDDPRYANQRDAGFSLFYMAINIGALFAPTAAVKITEYAQTHLGYTAPGEAYHFAFMVACASLVLSIAIYYLTRSTFRHTEDTGKKAKAAAAAAEPELSKEETKARIVALLLVFAVVIFFWMAFHQNGLSLTYFADEFTAKTASGVHTMPFDVINLVMIILIVYAGFSLYESKTSKGKGISALVILAALAVLAGDAYCKMLAAQIVMFLPYARTEATAKNHTVYRKMSIPAGISLFIQGMLPLAPLLYFGPAYAPLRWDLLIFVPCIVMYFLYYLMLRKLRGYTGDCCGALCLLIELSFYLTLVAQLYR